MDKGNEKRGIVQLLCILLSFGLWLYVSSFENPNRTSDIKGIPVEIVNSDALKNSNLALIPNQDFTITLKIEGAASEVYSVKAGDFKIRADLGDYALKKGENNIPIQIVNYPQNINIKNTSVLSIKVKIENFAEKDIKVSSKLDTSFKTGFSQRGIEIKPDTVKVSGAESSVVKVNYVAMVGAIKDISGDFEDNFEMKAFDSEGNEVKDVKLSQSTGSISMKVGKGKDVPVKVKYTGSLPNGMSIDKASLSKSNIRLIGDSENLDKVEFIETEPINLSNINGDKDIKVKLSVPEGMSVDKENEYINVNIKVKSNSPITKSFDVKIVYSGKDDKYTYEISQQSVSITLTGPEASLATITAANLKVEGVLTNLTEGSHDVEWKVSLINTDKNDITISPKSGIANVKVTLK